MNKLPDELLEHIVNAIDDPRPPYQPSKTLVSLCLVNRTLHRIATPRLYGNVVRIAPPYWRVEKINVFYSLLKALQTQPRLRMYIKQLQDIADITPSKQFTTAQEEEQSLPPLHGIDPQLLITALLKELKFELSTIEDLVARHVNFEDIWLTLCCLITPNIERITTVLRKRLSQQPSSNLIVEYISRSALGLSLGKVHSFHKLRYLHVEPELGFMLNFPITHAFPLVLLPNLKTLILGEWGATYEAHRYSLDTNQTTVFGKPWTWPLRQSSITELSIRDPHTTAEIVCNMIRACKALLTYEGTNVVPISVTGRPRERWYNHISFYLQEHCDTLREVRIWEEFSPIELPSIYGSLNTLPHMTCLTHLRTPWRLLMGWYGNAVLRERLPQTIEELTIELCDIPEEDLHTAFADLLAQSAQWRCDSLKHVHLIWRITTVPANFAFDIEHIRELYTIRKIRFDVTVDCSESTEPDPELLRVYEGIFPGYVRHKFDPGLGEYVPQRHFVSASTAYRSEDEHEVLMTGIPAWC